MKWIFLPASVALCLALTPACVAAGPLEEGTAAFDSQDFALAEKLLLPLAEHGDAAAEGMVGTIYAFGMLADRDSRAGFDWLNKAAARGDAGAEYALGQISLRGLAGRPVDLPTAADWLKRAASHADSDISANAQLELARLYENGLLGAPPSPEEAQTWYTKAAAGLEVRAGRGELTARLALAGLLAKGEGVPKDEVRSAQLYSDVVAELRRQAEAGAAHSQFRLAGAYRNGLGVPKDELLGLTWLLRAADQGEPSAMLTLATFYMSLDMNRLFERSRAPSDPENAVRAVVWVRLSAVYGPPGLAREAQSTADTASMSLTPEQRARVEELVQAYRPTKESSGAPGDGPVTPAQKQELDRLRGEIAATKITP